MVALAAAAIAPSVFAQATPPVITVANLADSGPGSLRQAIVTANSNRNRTTIRFAPGLACAILLTSGELRITSSMAISGPGADAVTISGNNASRVFHIESTAASAAGAPIGVTKIEQNFARNDPNVFPPGGNSKMP